jgi:hypothetical protein
MSESMRDRFVPPPPDIGIGELEGGSDPWPDHDPLPPRKPTLWARLKALLSRRS